MSSSGRVRKWYRHCIPPELLKDYIDHVFCEYTVVNGYVLGSTRKLLEGVDFIRDRVILRPENDLPFRTLLNSAYKLLKAHYDTFDLLELEVKYGAGVNQSLQIAQTVDDEPATCAQVQRPLANHDRLYQLFEEALGSEGQTAKLSQHQFLWETPKTGNKISPTQTSSRVQKCAKTSNTSDVFQQGMLYIWKKVIAELNAQQDQRS